MGKRERRKRKQICTYSRISWKECHCLFFQAKEKPLFKWRDWYEMVCTGSSVSYGPCSHKGKPKEVFLPYHNSSWVVQSSNRGKKIYSWCWSFPTWEDSKYNTATLWGLHSKSLTCACVPSRLDLRSVESASHSVSLAFHFGKCFWRAGKRSWLHFHQQARSGSLLVIVNV